MADTVHRRHEQASRTRSMDEGGSSKKEVSQEIFTTKTVKTVLDEAIGSNLED